MPRGKGGSFSITDRDKGYAKFQRATKHLAADKPYVKAGILERAGTEKDSSGLTVAALASIHEFGTEHIPERSFLRATQAAKASDIKAFILKLKDMPILNPRQALNLLGLQLVAYIKLQIQNGDYAPLSAKTIERKGSSRPLIDTGQLRNSVQHEVVEKR